MIRTANARHNTISRASARLWLIRAERSQEGDQLRRFYELKLDRSEHPMFVLSWMLFHVIDKDSPLHGVTASDLEEGDALLGAQCRRPRRQFRPAALCAPHLFVARHPLAAIAIKDITSVSPQGRFLLDYTKFNDVVAEERVILPLIPAQAVHPKTVIASAAKPSSSCRVRWIASSRRSSQ